MTPRLLAPHGHLVYAATLTRAGLPRRVPRASLAPEQVTDPLEPWPAGPLLDPSGEPITSPRETDLATAQQFYERLGFKRLGLEADPRPVGGTSTYAMVCADSGMDCPARFQTRTEDELVKHIELHVAVAHPDLGDVHRAAALHELAAVPHARIYGGGPSRGNTMSRRTRSASCTPESSTSR